MNILERHTVDNPGVDTLNVRHVIPWTHLVPGSDDYPAERSTLRSHYARNIW